MLLLRERRRQRAGIIELSLPTLAKKPLSGADLIHEIKHDVFWRGAIASAFGSSLVTAMISATASPSLRSRSDICRRGRT